MKIRNVRLFIETVQAMPIKFAVNIVRLKVNIICSQSDDIDVHSRSQLRLKLDKFVTCSVMVIFSAMAFKLGMTVDLSMACVMLRFISTALTLMQGHSGLVD